MIIGIIIGFIIHEAVNYIKGLIELRMRVKMMKARGKSVFVDYVHLRILDTNNNDKGEAYKRANIGFVYSKDES